MSADENSLPARPAPPPETDRILRCRNCGAKLGTYDDQHLDVGAGYVDKETPIICKKCTRLTTWRPRRRREF